MQGAITERIGGVASNKHGKLDEIRYEQGFIAGLKWALDDPAVRDADAKQALDEHEGDEDE